MYPGGQQFPLIIRYAFAAVGPEPFHCPQEIGSDIISVESIPARLGPVFLAEAFDEGKHCGVLVIVIGFGEKIHVQPDQVICFQVGKQLPLWHTDNRNIKGILKVVQAGKDLRGKNFVIGTVVLPP